MSSQSSQRRYIAFLAAISAGVLTFGYKLRPRDIADVPVSQAEMARLETLAQRRNLQDLTSYFSRISNDIKPSLVWISDLGTGGIIWNDDGSVVTVGPQRLSGSKVNAVTAKGNVVLRPDVLSSMFPVARLRASSALGISPVFRRSLGNLQPGTWIVQVASQPGGDYLISPGIYSGNARAKCGPFDVTIVNTNLPFGESTVGGGVFDMDGSLLGIVIRCDGEISAVTPGSVDSILVEAEGFAGQVARRYGVRVDSLNEKIRRHLGVENGLLVTEVCRGTPADVAGLAPGDVIQALDDHPVNNADDLARLVLPVAYPMFQLYVKRGPEILRLDVAARDSDSAVAGPESQQRGIYLAKPLTGYLIEDIVPGSRADRASLEPGDWLLTVAGKATGIRGEVQKLLSDSGGAPVFLVVQRGQRKLGVFLE